MYEHPEIAWIERTGYPSWAQPKPDICERCGDEIEGDVYEVYGFNSLCEECLKELCLRGDC